jgi:hypothetical protein
MDKLTPVHTEELERSLTAFDAVADTLALLAPMPTETRTTGDLLRLSSALYVLRTCLESETRGLRAYLKFEKQDLRGDLCAQEACGEASHG